MFTLTCCLRFSDGQTATAQISAQGKTEDTTVSCSGAVQRLPFRPEKANAIELKAFFKSFARELNAAFVEDERDDRWVPTRELDETLEHLLKLGIKKKDS